MLKILRDERSEWSDLLRSRDEGESALRHDTGISVDI